VPAFTPGPGWNIVADVQDMLSFAFMRNAFAAGTASAIVAGLIGYFVVLRGSSFAAHAISHIGFAGAAGAVLLGLNPVLGVAALSLAASAGMGMLGKRLRGRDVAIGLIMAASLGLGYLFISLYTGNAQNAYSILFGQIFGITTGAVLITIATSVVAPGAIAERVARRPGTALAVSGGLAVLITWASLALAYYTPYQVSFYVTSLAFAGYLAARAWTAQARRPRRPGPDRPAAAPEHA